MPSSELLDKREVRIRRMFGQIAPWYDFLNHALSLNIDKRWRTKTTRLVPPLPAEAGPILDLCTGTGDLALAYDRAAKGTVPIVGADFCHEMLIRAGEKAERRFRPIRFVEADAQALPFPDDSFQIVTVAFGLRNVTDTDRGLAEMVRVARPGGRIAILEFSRPRNRVFGPLFTFYFRHVLPRVGQLLSRSRGERLQVPAGKCPSLPRLRGSRGKNAAHGLQDVHFKPLTFGIATLYMGTKAG